MLLLNCLKKRCEVVLFVSWLTFFISSREKMTVIFDPCLHCSRRYCLNATLGPFGLFWSCDKPDSSWTPFSPGFHSS